MSEVSLKVYGKKSWDILHATVYTVAQCLGKRGAAAYLQVRMRPNGEVYAIYSDWRHPVNDLAANLAYQLKQVLHYRTKGEVNGRNYGEWLDREVILRDSDPSDNWKSIEVKTTVGALRCLYEILLGRSEKKIKEAYGKELFSQVKGDPADCFTATQKEIYVQELKKLMDAQKADYDRISKEYDAEYEALKQKYSELRAEAKLKHEQQVQDLKAKFGEDFVAEVSLTSAALN